MLALASVSSLRFDTQVLQINDYGIVQMFELGLHGFMARLLVFRVSDSDLALSLCTTEPATDVLGPSCPKTLIPEQPRSAQLALAPSSWLQGHQPGCRTPSACRVSGLGFRALQNFGAVSCRVSGMTERRYDFQWKQAMLLELFR